MTTLAFVCGKCGAAQVAPWGSKGRAGRCVGCNATVRVPEAALEYQEPDPVQDVAPSVIEPMVIGPEAYASASNPRPRKGNSQTAFLLLLCLAPALVSSMAVNVYLALQLRSVVARQMNK